VPARWYIREYLLNGCSSLLCKGSVVICPLIEEGYEWFDEGKAVSKILFEIFF